MRGANCPCCKTKKEIREMQEQQQEHRKENIYRTPLQKWVDALHVFNDDIEECEKEDDALYLIKQ